MTAGNGKACKKCGTREWYSGGACVACQRERSRLRQQANPEKHREYSRRWAEANQEQKRESNRRWAAANPEKNGRWNAANPEKGRERSRRWAAANPDRVRDLDRRWHEANPEARRAIKQNRRARKSQAGGSFTAGEWKALCAQYDNHCCYPGCERTDLHADHVTPVSKGGTSDISNIQPLCAHHNRSKATATTDYRHKGGVLRWLQKKLFG